jgi:hypothetical protein
LIHVYGVSCNICLSRQAEFRGLVVQTKFTKIGIQRIKMNSQFMILILFLDDVGAIFAERIQHNIAMDMAAKAREDPLFAIRYFMGLARKFFTLFLW